MRFHLFLGNHDQTGRDTIHDMMEWLTAGLTELNHQVTVDKFIAPNAINVIWENFVDKDVEVFDDSRFKFGLIATEIPVGQTFNWLDHEPWLTRRRCFEKIAPRAQFIWSMVEEPVKAYERWAPAGYLELGFSEKIIDPVFFEEPKADFGFYGLHISSYRNAVLDRLKSQFVVATPDRFLKGHELNQFIASFKVGICLKHSAQWTIPSPARISRLLHAKRGIAAEYTPVRTRATRFVSMAEENEDFAEFCLNVLHDRWKQRAEDAYEQFRAAMPMKQILEQLLDKTVWKSLSSGAVETLAHHGDVVRHPVIPYESEPQLVDRLETYNLVRFQNRVYALEQALGPMDLSQEADRLIERFGPNGVIVAETIEEARSRILARLGLQPGAVAAQPQLIDQFGRYNLVSYKNRVYALDQGIGPVDLAIEGDSLIERFGHTAVIVANTLEEARSRVIELSESELGSHGISLKRTSDHPPTLSIIIPTIGRTSLTAAIKSAANQTGPGDEILVIGDGPQPVAREISRQHGASVSYHETPMYRNWGHGNRNFAMKLAKGDYLMFLDDDDVFTREALRSVRTAVTASPGHPIIFRMTTPDGLTLWSDPIVRIQNVGTPMFVIPNDPQRLGRFGIRYEGDFDFISSTLALYPAGSLIWNEEIICNCRPMKEDGRPNIIVFGVGHSGTTIVTRMLVDIGWKNATDADSEYAESIAIREANDHAIRHGALPQIADSLLSLLLPEEPWVIKDPRFVVTLPLWKPLMLPHAPTLLWLTRETEAVKASYISRSETTDGVPALYGKTVDGLLHSANVNYNEWRGKKVKLEYESVFRAVEKFSTVRK